MLNAIEKDNFFRKYFKLKKLKKWDFFSRTAPVFAHKSLTNKTTKSIYQKYQKFRPKTETRSSKNYKINIPRHNLSKYKKSPFFRTIKAWNQATPFLGFGEIKGHKNSFQAAMVEECCS